MKIIQKMAKKAQNVTEHEGVTIAFLGDSVTQGCFEVYKKLNGDLETVFDQQHSYHRYVFDLLTMLFPETPINIVNAGISGTRAPNGLARLERDVLRHQPDLTVVCFGLNDCSGNPDSIETYTSALSEIFDQVRAAGSELIFMTPNMMSTNISPHLPPEFKELGEMMAFLQNDGLMDAHMDAVRALCKQKNVPLCDCYAIWKKLHESGVNVTELLSNRLNHPTREMNRLFAEELVRTMFTVD